jgi:MFS transporter, ACS family, pantothenate transporter
MAYPHEKAVENAFITEASELPVVLKSELPENDAPVYIQSKRTWKSYFWSSESFKLRKDPRIIAD